MFRVSMSGTLSSPELMDTPSYNRATKGVGHGQEEQPRERCPRYQEKVPPKVLHCSVNIAKGYRQINKAASALSSGNLDGVSRHLNSALNNFGSAVDHAAKAADDVCTQAGNEIGKCNAQLEKCIKAYADGSTDEAQTHYDGAVKNYDKALDLIGD